MKKLKFNFEEFQNEKLSANQQKKVRGGDEAPIDPNNDPSKKGGGNGNP